MPVAYGGLGVVSGTAADRAAFTAMQPGTQFFETDTRQLKVWTGAAWVILAYCP